MFQIHLFLRQVIPNGGSTQQGFAEHTTGKLSITGITFSSVQPPGHINGQDLSITLYNKGQDSLSRKYVAEICHVLSPPWAGPISEYVQQHRSKIQKIVCLLGIEHKTSRGCENANSNQNHHGLVILVQCSYLSPRTDVLQEFFLLDILQQIKIGTVQLCQTFQLKRFLQLKT